MTLRETADWHAKGLFAVQDPEGQVLADTLDTTAYSARAKFIRNHNILWSQAEAKGYALMELAIVGRVVRAPGKD